ncbi:MAG: 50S ribosomal protein L15 [Legionellales bacterium RIFCSPHIGHO2_12_FULL_42_9]|nr:MAG: 50S ribosomal protein L15 [Legionellales bacterium RIFCSPHIGHO2_12_FULL_42_9]
MKLNTIAPACGSKKSNKRLGRGIGSGFGKTSGKGHKGQKARAGGYHKINFEGGQMPIQRRLPKMGFKSKTARQYDEVTLSELSKVKAEIIDLQALIKAGIISKSILRVKIILSGKIDVPVNIKGIKLTKGAREAVLQVGGSITE